MKQFSSADRLLMKPADYRPIQYIAALYGRIFGTNIYVYSIIHIKLPKKRSFKNLVFKIVVISLISKYLS